MVGRAVGEDGGGSGSGGGNKSFSLFSAINGLFERARSSAEKESQRLFTSPIPQSRLVRERRLDRTSESGEPTADSLATEQYALAGNGGGGGGGGGSPRSALPESLAMAKRRPRPARSHSYKSGSASHKRPTPHSRSPPFHAGSPDEEAPTETFPPPAAAIDESAVAADEEGPHDAIDAPTPNTASKRKRSVRRSPSSPVPERYADSPKRVRADAATNLEIRTPDLGPLDASEEPYGERDYEVEQHSSELSRKSAAQAREADVSAFSIPPVALQRTSTVSTAVSDSAYRFRNDISTSAMRTSEYVAARRAEVTTTSRSSSVIPPRHGAVSIEKPELSPPRLLPSIVEAPPSPAPVVERARLEKVERELHRLKKIIASLLPDELNDDDLRSVYGDMDQYQPRRMSSDDIIMQLMKTRLGAAAQFSARYNAMSSAHESSLPNLPPSPTSNSPTNYGLSARSMPPPPAPPPPPLMHPVAAALLAGRQTQYGDNLDTGRPRSVASLLRRNSVTSDTASSMLGEYPPVHSAIVRRLRADLRPVSANPLMPTLQRHPPPPPPPPHKDPGVMTQLLEEMKHHKLRSVRKPKDMAIH